MKWTIILTLVLPAFQAVEARSYHSPVVLVADGSGKYLYVAESSRVSEIDLETHQVKRFAALSEAPSGLAISPDGSTLYVTCADPEGTIYAVNPSKKWFRTRRFSAGHTPTSPVISPDGKMLYTCNRFDDDISVFDLATCDEIAQIPVKKEPVAAALTPNGGLLFVANSLPTGPANVDPVAAAVSVIDTKSNRVIGEIALPSGSHALGGLAISPDGAFAYVTHILSRFHMPTTQVERGWINTNALSIIDVKSRNLLNTVLLDDIDLGAPNPWGVACSPDGESLCIALSGSHEIMVVDRSGLHRLLDQVVSGERVMEAVQSAQDVPNALGFLADVSRRIRLQGKGPRNLTIFDSTLYVCEYFSGTIGVVDLASEDAPLDIPLGPEPPMDPVRLGELYFHDANLCFQKWQSCSSCHPEGRSDGLNWDLANDGIGNPRNAKSLLLSHETPPAMITGVRDSAETGVRAGLSLILNYEQPEGVAEALDAYLKSLRPVPSPHLRNGRLSKAARRGRKLFEEADCALCHPAPLYTDMKKHDVGTTAEDAQYRELDTPTLVECWRTAPYLYDGRAASMYEVLTKHNQMERHGKTAALSEEQLADLAEFVLSQ